MSVLDKNGLGDWLADRLVEIGDSVKDDFPLRIDVTRDPFLDDRLRVANLPEEPQTLTVKNSVSRRGETGEDRAVPQGRAKPRAHAAAISEIIKWLNYVTDNRALTLAADLSESVNLEHGSIWGHYDPETNPLGTRLKAAIQEAGNVSTAIGLVEPERVGRSRQVRRRLGFERHLRRVHAADVSARARLEPAEPGQQVPDGRPAHPRRRIRGPRRPPMRARTSASSRRRCGSCFRAATSST